MQVHQIQTIDSLKSIGSSWLVSYVDINFSGPNTQKTTYTEKIDILHSAKIVNILLILS